MFLEAILDCGLAQAVTFFESMREIAFDFAAKDREDFDQDGGGADAIDVVITEDDDGLGVAARLEQAFHEMGGRHDIEDIVQSLHSGPRARGQR